MLTFCEIDLAAIRHNLRQIKKFLDSEVKLAAVIKSDAYGHGLFEVAKAVSEAGAHFLCVDNLSEGTVAHKAIKSLGSSLREVENSYSGNKPPILILGGVESKDFEEVVKKDFRIGIYNLNHAKELNKAAEKLNKTANIFLKIDTGMHRLGIEPGEALNFAKELSKLGGINLEGVWSHFADSGSPDSEEYTLAQLEKFKNLKTEFKVMGIHSPIWCLANSAGAILYPQARLDMVRVGIVLYGVWPSKYVQRKIAAKVDLKPALSFKTKIVQVKEIEKGAKVGYGLTYEAKRKMRIAIVPVGYKDGYGRHLSNKGEVLVKGIRCPVRGRICMRMTIIDVSKIREIKSGEQVVLLGKQKNDRIEASELAEKMGTIPYEVLARISESVPRIYKS